MTAGLGFSAKMGLIVAPKVTEIWDYMGIDKVRLRDL